MFGNTQLTTIIGADPKDCNDVKKVVQFARKLVDAGLPLLLVKPGTKFPLDMRTQREIQADQEQAEAYARTHGVQVPKTGGVHLATTDRKRIERFITRAMADPKKRRSKGTPAPVKGQVNFAVRLADSGYVVADADTPEEVAALNDYLKINLGIPHAPGATVLTPGTVDGAHSGGGHWWMKLPDGFVIDADKVPSVMKIQVPGHEAGFSLYLGNAYVLIPPSVRDAGPYQLVTSDFPAPQSIMELLNGALVKGEERVKARQARVEQAHRGLSGTLDQQICDWAESMPWHEILVPHGWIDTGVHDSCGCPIYTAPGTHSSPKSATAHEGDCSTGRYDLLNPPLHIWTDNPGGELEAEIAARGGSKTLSKLTVWAALEHGGDMARALTSAGIERDPEGHVIDGLGDARELPGVGKREPLELVETSRVEIQREQEPIPSAVPEEWVEHVDTERVVRRIQAQAGSRRPAPRDPIDMGMECVTPDGLDVWSAWGTAKPVTDEGATELRKFLPPFAKLAAYRESPDVEFIVEGMFEKGGLCSLIGDSGVGKSAVALDMAACVATGRPWHGKKTMQTNVCYVAGEGVQGAVQRLHAWQDAYNDRSTDDSVFIVEEAMLAGRGKDKWAFLAEQIIANGIGLVVFDTLARMTTGLDENSAKDMGESVRYFDMLRKTTGATVVLVHHTTRGASHGRGSSAIRGALDSEVLVTDVMEDGRPFACDQDNHPVDSEGRRLPGNPITIQVVKQKNGPDDVHVYASRTPMHGSIVVTDLDGHVGPIDFAKAELRVVESVKPEAVETTAERIVTYVSQFKAKETMPTLPDIARGVRPDPGRAGKTLEWRSHVLLATDYAVASGRLYKHRARFSIFAELE